MNFNRLYEDIFKAASPEEVMKRKEQGEEERIKDLISSYFRMPYEEILKKENINKFDDNGRPPLYIASLYRNINIIKQLLEHGADPNIKNKNWLGDTSLTITIQRANNIEKDIPIIKLLLDHGADTNIITDRNLSPLDCAIRYLNTFFKDSPKLEIIKLLLDNGANPNVENYHGEEEVGKLLKQYGAK